MDSLSVFINSKDRVEGSSINDAKYNINWNAILGEGRYRMKWAVYKIPPQTNQAVVTPVQPAPTATPIQPTQTPTPTTTPTPVNQTAYQKLLVDKKPWGRYSAESWSGTTLPELGGTSSRNATTSGISSAVVASGNGSTSNITSIGGTTTSTISFPVGSLPATYVIFSITRYNSGTHGRVLTNYSGNSDWLHGHYGNMRGVGYHGAGIGWVTPEVTVGNIQDWLSMGATNSGIAIPNNVYVDNKPIGVRTDTIVNGGRLIINSRESPSDFEFSQLIIFDQALSVAEMEIVSNAFQKYLSTGVLDTPTPTPTPTPPAPPPTPVFQYLFNTSLLHNEASNQDDGVNHGAVLDNSVFIRGSGSVKIIGNNTPSYVSTPTFPILANTGYTLSTWFKVAPGTLSPFAAIFCNNNSNYPSFVLGQDYTKADCMFFYSTNAGNSALINIFYTTPVFDNTWHHTIISISADHKTLRWFVDGVQIAYSNRQSGSDPSIYPQSKEFQMGSTNNFTGTYNLDNFIFYDRELSASEAVQLYNY